uniref:GIY-YIG homing endonuclease n=1 Tax=Cyathus striatus TaxID=68777 RepID=UPI0023F121F1
YEHSPKWFNKDNFVIFNSIIPFFLYSNKSFLKTEKTNFIFNSLNSLNSLNSNKSYNYLANDPKIVDIFIKDKNLNPIYKYDKLDSQETIERVSKEIKHISGIYLILNKLTLDYYIGSASTNKMYSRFSRHLIYLTGSKIVKLAIKKYGLSNFAFLVLEIFPEIVTQENNKQLLDLEDFYLKSLIPNYNILTEAGSSFGYKHTEITRINMKAQYSLERRLRIGELNKGKSFSPETIEKMKSKALERESYSYSDKGYLNLKKRSKSLLVYNLNGTLFGEYLSLTEASKILKSSLKTINRCLKTDKKILKRQWILKLKN